MCEGPDRCPQHGTYPDDWGCCPDFCEEFGAEMQRRVDDVVVHGNFVRTWIDGGARFKQTFRDHQPIDEPQQWGRTA